MRQSSWYRDEGEVFLMRRSDLREVHETERRRHEMPAMRAAPAQRSSNGEAPPLFRGRSWRTWTSRSPRCCAGADTLSWFRYLVRHPRRGFDRLSGAARCSRTVSSAHSDTRLRGHRCRTHSRAFAGGIHTWFRRFPQVAVRRVAGRGDGCLSGRTMMTAGGLGLEDLLHQEMTIRSSH